MPPKRKPKTKTKTEKVKAVAKTKKGGAQAQVQNVVVKVGETKKPARRRRKPTQKKDDIPPTIPPRPFYDGWFPPQNLTRNGSFPYQIAPPIATSGSISSFVAGAPTSAPTFVSPSAPPLMEEPEMQSGLDSSFAPEADSGFNVTEFLKEWKQPKQREMYDPFLTPEEAASFAPPIPEPPTFAEPVPEPPPFVEPPTPAPKKKPEIIIEEDEEEQVTLPEIKKMTQAALIKDIKEAERKLRDNGVIGSDQASRKAFNKEIYVDLFGKPKESEYSKYNKTQLEMIRDRIKLRYGV